MNPRRRTSLAGSPLLIGAVTTLIVVVAVFLSYNAKEGLPFVPTYNLKLVLPETSELQPNDQVRIAGTRVGLISSLTPHQNQATGRVTAIADLKLEKGVEPLPADTKAVVQSTTSIGTKYLELEKGTSQKTLKQGATIPVSQTREPVDLNQFFDMFDQKTRTAIQKNTINFGDGLAGRGLGLNEAIATLRPLVTNAIPALRNLAAPKTGFRELWYALDRPAEQTARVAQQNANLFSDLDTFFKAWAGAAPSLERTIEGGPPALQQATYSLPYEAPFMEKSAEFMRLLRPTASVLRTEAKPLGHAFAVGAVNLSAATALNTRLAAAAQAFEGFAKNPVVTLGLEELTQTARVGEPLVAGLAPEQVTCNYLTLAFRNVASFFAEDIGVGTLARVMPVLSPDWGQRRGLPLLGAGQRPLDRPRSRPGGQTRSGDRRQPPALQPLPERRRSRPAAGVRSGQRDLRRGSDGDRPRARQQRRHSRSDHPRTEPVRAAVHERHAEGSGRGWREGKGGSEEEGTGEGEGKSKEEQGQDEGEAQMSRLRLRPRRRRDELSVVEMQRYNPLRFGVVFLVILVIGVYFGFTKHIPFKHGYRLKAVFATALDIHAKSPVRIAGIDVGTVSSIRREGDTGLVSMEIESKGLPIHADATLKIRPRLFLEGNWFVELQPGSPTAKTLSSGATIPITQTADPVQLDQVLDALNTDTRANLQNFLQGYGDALTRKPDAAENAEQEPEVRGLNAAQALNKSYHRGPSALRSASIDAQAVTGTEEHDLSKLIASIGKVAGALNVHEQDLGELIVNFNTFFHSLAAQAPSLSATVTALPGALTSLDRGFSSLAAALPPTRTFALDILPGIKQTPATISTGLPWIEQVKAALAPSELGGVAKGLVTATPALARVFSESTAFFKQTNLFSQCLTKVFYPAANAKLQDGANTSGVEDFREFFYATTGLASLGQTFDGNGSMTRFLVGGGGPTFRSAPVGIVGTSPKGLSLVARSPLTPEGTSPAFPAEEPPYKPLVPCYTQAVPNFNGPLSHGPADGSGG